MNEMKHNKEDLEKRCKNCNAKASKTKVDNHMYCEPCKKHFCFHCGILMDTNKKIYNHLVSAKHRI